MPPKGRLGSWQSFGDVNDESNGGLTNTNGKKKKGQRSSGHSGPVAFRSEHRNNPGTLSPNAAQVSLLEVFGDVLPADIIEAVLLAHSNNPERAMEALFEMTQPGQNDNTGLHQETKISMVKPLSDKRSSASALTSNMHTPHNTPIPLHVSTSAASQLHTPSSVDQILPSYWDLVPLDVRHLILQRLPYKALAKAAPTCTDFATRIRVLREKVRTVEVPATATALSLAGMIASHSQAAAVNLSRLAPSLKHCEAMNQVLMGLMMGARSERRGVAVRGLNLRRIQVLSEVEIQYICQHLDELRELDLSECQGVGDAALRCLARYLTAPPSPSDPSETPPPRGLTTLNLSRCDSISSDAVKDLLLGPATRTSLRWLDVSHCMRLNSGAFYLPSNSRLQVLRAGGCNALTRLSLQLPPTAPLQELQLPFSPLLSQVVVVADQLRLLNLSGCYRLAELSLRCRGLEELNLAQTTSLSVMDVTHLPRLHTININTCREMETLTLQQLTAAALALRNLDMRGCRLVSSLHLPNHRELQAVDVHGCTNLRSVSTSSPSLKSLDATACGALTSLALQTDALEVLNLAKCSSLTTVMLSDSGQGDAGRKVGGAKVTLRGCRALGRDVVEMLEKLKL